MLWIFKYRALNTASLSVRKSPAPSRMAALKVADFGWLLHVKVIPIVSVVKRSLKEPFCTLPILVKVPSAIYFMVNSKYVGVLNK
ncbi:hypothetical protein NC651_026302 [Populus alba x Populus x berolinensis]|nr:hypothetical protein NC651_026302 [Populus alba x Populus x berolinensis]